MEFSPELRGDVPAGDITGSVRLWTRPQVKEGDRQTLRQRAAHAASKTEPAVSRRHELRRTELRVARVVGADPARRCLHLRSHDGEESELGYDQLILATSNGTASFTTQRCSSLVGTNPPAPSGTTR